MLRTAVSMAAALVFAGACAPTCNASTVLFNNLTTDLMPFNSTVINLDNYEIAGSFTPSQTMQLSHFEIPLGFAHVDVNPTVAIHIFADGGGFPGTLLESFDYTGDYQPPAFNLRTINSVVHPVLTAGQRYWIGVHETNPNFGVWYMSLLGGGPEKIAVRNLAGNTWQYPSPPSSLRLALRVHGDTSFEPGVTATPEPLTIALSGCGLLAIGLCRRLRPG